MGRAGFIYSWRKIEAAAPDRVGWRQVVCGYAPPGATSQVRTELFIIHDTAQPFRVTNQAPITSHKLLVHLHEGVNHTSRQAISCFAYKPLKSQ